MKTWAFYWRPAEVKCYQLLGIFITRLFGVRIHFLILMAITNLHLSRASSSLSVVEINCRSEGNVWPTFTFLFS